MFYIQHHLDRRQPEFCFTAAFRNYDRALEQMITWSILNRTTYYVVKSGKKHPIVAKCESNGTVYEYNENGGIENIYK